MSDKLTELFNRLGRLTLTKEPLHVAAPGPFHSYGNGVILDLHSAPAFAQVLAQERGEYCLSQIGSLWRARQPRATPSDLRKPEQIS